MVAVIRLFFVGALIQFVSQAAFAEEDSARLTAQLAESGGLNLSLLIETLARNALKQEYVDDRKWNKEERVIEGWEWEQGKLRARKREVNHGLWQRYRLRPIDPEHQFRVTALPLGEKSAVDQTAVNPKPATAGSQPIRFELQVSTRVGVQADYAWWTWGVKGINGSVEADAQITARAVCSLTTITKFDPGSLLPDIRFCPGVEELHLRLEDLDLNRVFLLKGPVAREMGKGMRHTIEDILQKQEPRFLEKIQRSLDKRAKK